jgi:hypothetical protein
MSEELKEELSVAFNATWTEQLIEQSGTDRSMLGKPIFYTASGELDAAGLAKQLEVSEKMVSESFQNWTSAGNKPPGVSAPRTPAAATGYTPPVFAKFEPEPVAAQQNTISSATTSLNEMTAYNTAKFNQQQAADAMAPQPPQLAQGGDQSTQLLGMLIPHIMGSNSNKGDDSLVMLKLLESQNMQAERSRQDQAMMMNAMNTNSTQMMALLIDSMKNGGGRSSTDDVLVQFALEEMRGGKNNSPEESVFDNLVKSGQLADITGSIASSLKSVMAARSPPVGAVPNYAIQEQPRQVNNPPQMQQPEYPMQQQYPVQQEFEQPEPIEASFEDKCRVVMGQIHESLPKEWKANSDFIEVLRRSTERAVTRAEDFHPISVEHQLQRAMKELLVVINLRLIGTSIKQIRDGTVSTPMAAAVLREHPLFSIFQSETYESLIEMMTAYIDCDVPGQKNIGYDIEFLSGADNRQVIEEVLHTAKQG